MTIDRAALFETSFEESGGNDLIGRARLDAIANYFGAVSNSAEDFENYASLAWSFESLGARLARDGESERRVAELFDRAFRARTASWDKGTGSSLVDAWMLVTSGVCAQRQPELRLLLRDLVWEEKFGEEPSEWVERLWWNCARSLVLLARKGKAWQDIDAAIAALDELAAAQREFKDLRVEHQVDLSLERRSMLLALYHLAEGLIFLGRYLRTGEPESVVGILQRKSEAVRELLKLSGDLDLMQVGATVEAALTAMTRSSIWFNTSRLSQAARAFVKSLTDSSSDSPVTELWWSQREALSQSLLDPYKVAVSVQMPTSAGKTLLAEFSIIQSLALNPAAVVVYIVPTRALVNQITRRLRSDFAGSSVEGSTLTVEAAVPVFELDSTEDSLLRSSPKVLVTTPEKLDLLIRSDHVSVRDISLVVVDEAHHIADASRGARLELLLATLKRERGQRCHFLLLTPFLPNASDLAEWLGGEDRAAISLDWRPSEQIRALAKWRKKSGVFENELRLLPSATQPHVWQDAIVPLGKSLLQPAARGRPAISTAFAAALAVGSGGGTLILTRGPGTAESRALAVASEVGSTLKPIEGDGDELLIAAQKYVEDELGSEHPLSTSLKRGVGIHHAGLPPEVRSLVEVLIERGSVKVVAGTSTLAQGVNFPLSSVVIETLSVSQGRGKPNRPLSFSEFWNIAGRAGRALKDPVGLVVYPSVNVQDDQRFIEYLTGEAASVVSALANAFSTLSDDTEFGLKLVRENRALGDLLQYLTHCLKIAGYSQASAEVEDIIRSSLVFHDLRRSADRESAEALVQWSKRFLASAQTNQLVPIADHTGLSLPSVGYLSARAPKAMSSPEFWDPSVLFGADLDPLTGVVELIADLPEMSLADPDQQGGINARRVAGITRDWVVGRSIPEIAAAWFGEGSGSVTAACRYIFRELTGQVPWGLGALQLVTTGKTLDADGVVNSVAAPAMAYYGVADPSAVALRMIGVPRGVATAFASSAPRFASYEEARGWVRSVPLASWDSAAEQQGLTGQQLKAVWRAVAGESGSL